MGIRTTPVVELAFARPVGPTVRLHCALLASITRCVSPARARSRSPSKFVLRSGSSQAAKSNSNSIPRDELDTAGARLVVDREQAAQTVFQMRDAATVISQPNRSSPLAAAERLDRNVRRQQRAAGLLHRGPALAGMVTAVIHGSGDSRVGGDQRRRDRGGGATLPTNRGVAEALESTTIEEIPVEASFLAGRAHAEYRRAGGARPAVLPDFLIGAHAAVTGRALLTRDPRRVARYLPGAAPLKGPRNRITMRQAAPSPGLITPKLPVCSPTLLNRPNPCPFSRYERRRGRRIRISRPAGASTRQPKIGLYGAVWGCGWVIPGWPEWLRGGGPLKGAAPLSYLPKVELICPERG